MYSKKWEVWEKIYDNIGDLKIEKNNYGKIKEILKSQERIVDYD